MASIFYYKDYVRTQRLYLEGDAVTGFTLDGDHTTAALNISGDNGIGLLISGTNTTGIQVGVDGTEAGDVFFYGAVSGTYVQWDDDANDYGRLKVVNASTRLTCASSINVCAQAITQTVDAAEAAVGAHGLWSTCTIGAFAMTAATYTHYAGVHGDAIISGTLSGAGVHVFGVLGEIRGTGTQTTANVVAAVAAKYNNATELGTGDSCLFWGWSHAGVVDYGLLLEASGSGSVGIGLQLGTDAAPVGDMFVYGEASGTYIQWDHDANSQGRFKVVEASSRLSCSHHDGQNTGLGNECCLSARQSHNCNTTTGQTQGGRAILAVYTLETANTNASELSWAGMFGIEGTCTLNGTLNGSKVNAFGVCGELRGAGAITECEDIAPLAAINNNSVNPSSGRKSMIYSNNSSGTVDAVLTHKGSATSLFDFDDASGFVLEDSKAYPDKAGNIKVIMPSGGAAYINLYDGSPGT